MIIVQKRIKFLNFNVNYASFSVTRTFYSNSLTFGTFKNRFNNSMVNFKTLYLMQAFNNPPNIKSSFSEFIPQARGFLQTLSRVSARVCELL